MKIIIKDKDTLLYDEFKFKCSVGKNGKTTKKIEGDNKTPKGSYALGPLYYRKDRLEKPATSLKCIEIKKNMGWCDDVHNPEKYNKLIRIDKSIKFEKLRRTDHKYDLLLPIKYNFKNPIIGLGSCIFIHLTNNYQPTSGCIALKKKDFLILIKLINKKTRIRIS